MGNLKKYISWILLVIVIIVSIIVGRSIWYSLQDTRAELKVQKEKMDDLVNKDAEMHAYVDSLDQEIIKFKAEEERLANEREKLEKRLKQIKKKYEKILAKIDDLWEADSITNELDAAFPNWKGQFWARKRGDGIHGIIAPQFFGAEVLEIKAKLDSSVQKIDIKNRIIINLDSTIHVKDNQVIALTSKADSLKSIYEKLWPEYKDLDEKYTDLLNRKWFTLRLSPGNIVAAGAGLATGYAVSSLRNK